MTYTPLAMANAFLARHGAEGSISHMKLQKLVYYSYGWWLAYNEKPLLVEGPEVWKFGPVFASLYSVCSVYGSQPLKHPIKATPFGSTPALSEEDKQASGLADWIWERYGSATAMSLSNETHQVGSPWQREAEKFHYRVPPHHKIPDNVIREFFKEEASRFGAVAP